jgi:hypothetical protein
VVTITLPLAFVTTSPGAVLGEDQAPEPEPF